MTAPIPAAKLLSNLELDISTSVALFKLTALPPKLLENALLFVKLDPLIVIYAYD